jgi:hypothetical protein
MKRVIGGAVLTLLVWVAGIGLGSATLPIQKQAKAAGAESATCMACHNEKLPKKDAMTLNDKGKWLAAEKETRKAKVVDGAWLKDYKEKK